MTPSTALTWIIVVVALVGLLVYFSYCYMMKDLEKKRKAFKPSIIHLGYVGNVMYYFSGGAYRFRSNYISDATIFETYDQAITILEMVKETYPDAYLKEI